MENTQHETLAEVLDTAHDNYTEDGKCREDIIFQVHNGFHHPHRQQSGEIRVYAKVSNWRNTVKHIVGFNGVGNVRIDVWMIPGSDKVRLCVDYSNKRDCEKLYDHCCIECEDDTREETTPQTSEGNTMEKVSFIGRKLNAIGIFYRIYSLVPKGSTTQEAREYLYDRYEGFAQLTFLDRE